MSAAAVDEPTEVPTVEDDAKTTEAHTETETEDQKKQRAVRQGVFQSCASRPEDRQFQMVLTFFLRGLVSSFQSNSTLRTRTFRLTSVYAPKRSTYCRALNNPAPRFMWTLHTANAEHWVSVKTVASFKRMREFQPLGDDWVVDALKTSEELEVDAAGENVRRRTEVQPPKGQFERSVYAVRVLGCFIGVGVAHVLLGRGIRKGLGRKSRGCRRSWRRFSTGTAGRTQCA